MSKKLRTILGVVLLIAVAFFAYTYFFTSDEDADLVTTSQAGELDREIIDLLLTLQSIELDGEFLDSPLLSSMTDFRVVLTPQPVGRTNPFAPVGSDPASSVERTLDTDDEDEGLEEATESEAVEE